MAWRLYLMPLELVANWQNQGEPARVPKYWSTLNGGRWELVDAGSEPVCLVASDTSATEHTTLQGLADVQVIPAASLDTQIGSLSAGVQTRLEAMRIPVDALPASMTNRELARFVVRMWQLLQRLHALKGDSTSIFAGGLTLDSTLSQIPVGARAWLAQVATDLRIDLSDRVSGATTLRQLFTAVAARMADRPLRLGQLVI